jgi:HAD superfamily hydrolase (TIGR01509 family)
LSVGAIFWDNDGVLVDTEHLYFRATREVLSAVDFTFSREQYIELLLIQSCGPWHLVEAAGVSAEKIQSLREERDALYRDLLREGPRVLPGVEDVLAELHGRCAMGIVTSSKREHFDLIHQSSGLLPYFDFVIAAGDYANPKPEPDPYLRAIERSGMNPADCLVIEDSPRGLLAATRAGLRCIVIPTPLSADCDFSGAYRVLTDVRQLDPLLQSDAGAAQ